jgi:hypothetical protein
MRNRNELHYKEMEDKLFHIKVTYVKAEHEENHITIHFTIIETDESFELPFTIK